MVSDHFPKSYYIAQIRLAIDAGFHRRQRAEQDERWREAINARCRVRTITGLGVIDGESREVLRALPAGAAS